MTEYSICLKRTSFSGNIVGRGNMYFKEELDTNNPVKNFYELSQVTEGCIGCEMINKCELGNTFVKNLEATEVQTKVSILKRGNPRLP